MSIAYSNKVKVQSATDAKPDDIQSLLNEEMILCPSIDQFNIQVVKQTEFKPFGELVHQYDHVKDGVTKQFQVYKITVPFDSDECGRFLHQAQSFSRFLIDAATFIDDDDDQWVFLVMHEKLKLPDSSIIYPFVGYAALYHHYAYPDHIRPRIGQILILPTYQKAGHGAQLLQTIYRMYIGNSKIVDVTVEDPSESFVRLRDYVDCINCMRLCSFQADKIRSGRFSVVIVNEARDKLKIGKKQARRVYEILRLKSINRNDDAEFRRYRLDVKRRLNIPFQRKPNDWVRLQMALTENELASHALSRSERIPMLESLFEKEVEHYDSVLVNVETAAKRGSLAIV